MDMEHLEVAVNPDNLAVREPVAPCRQRIPAVDAELQEPRRQPVGLQQGLVSPEEVVRAGMFVAPGIVGVTKMTAELVEVSAIVAAVDTASDGPGRRSTT